MPPGGEGVPLLHGEAAVRDVGVEKLADHGDGFRAGHHLGLGVGAEHRSQGGAVVRLHVVDNNVVQGPALKGMLQVLVEMRPHGAVRRVQQDGLLVPDQIGVVADAPGDGEHVFKQAQPPVGPADEQDVGCNIAHVMHNAGPPSCSLSLLQG